MRSFVRPESSWVSKDNNSPQNKKPVCCVCWIVQSCDTWSCNAMNNKTARGLYLFPPNYNTPKINDSHTFHKPLEKERIRLCEQQLKQEIVGADETVQETTLEATHKTTLVNVLDSQKSTSETQHTSSGSISINTKIQSVITKLIELGLSSSKLERSRIIIQAIFKNSKVSLNEQLDILLEGSATQENLQTFLSNLQVPRKKLSEKILWSLQVSTHIVANVKGKDVA